MSCYKAVLREEATLCALVKAIDHRGRVDARMAIFHEHWEGYEAAIRHLEEAWHAYQQAVEAVREAKFRQAYAEPSAAGRQASYRGSP